MSIGKTQQPAGRSTTGPRVAVLGDDAAFKSLAAAWLAAAGFIVACGAGGLKGLESLRQERGADGILLDLGAAGDEDEKALAILAAEFPELPVVAVSAAQDSETVIRALRLGVRDYLVKPLADQAALAQALTTAINRAELLRERLLAKVPPPKDQLRGHRLAHHDDLTDLPNRFLFRDRLQRMMTKARRTGLQVAVLFFDLDRFKKINETLGHEIGDRVLRQVSRRLTGCIRASDTVVRLGGDEFAVLLDDIKDTKDVGVVTRKILQRLSEVVVIDSYELYTSSSVGISLFPADSQEVEGLMMCAETAMYRAKEQTSNSYQFYTADMNTRAFEFLLLENGLRKALEQEELVLFFQPQFDLAAGRLIGMEALVRWQHPQRGMIAPDDFIPLAEETGLIVPIGEWVLRSACMQNKAWQEHGYPPARMAVNLSGRQFRQHNVFNTVAAVLAETGLAPEFIELELTESTVMRDADAAAATLHELKRLGVGLAIDDFGTGYSSLAYLKLFPIDKLKIDRSFIKNINQDANDRMIARAIIALAHSMRMQVVAEGVEDEAQLRLLEKQGCDSIQGFLLGRPVPAHEFVRFFSKAGKGRR